MWPEIVGILIATVPIAPTFGTLGKIFFKQFYHFTNLNLSGTDGW